MGQNNGKLSLAVFVFLNIPNILHFKEVKHGGRKTLRQLGRLILCYKLLET
jgi:hypothetical protein